MAPVSCGHDVLSSHSRWVSLLLVLALTGCATSPYSQLETATPTLTPGQVAELQQNAKTPDQLGIQIRVTERGVNFAGVNAVEASENANSQMLEVPADRPNAPGWSVPSAGDCGNCQWETGCPRVARQRQQSQSVRLHLGAQPGRSGDCRSQAHYRLRDWRSRRRLRGDCRFPADRIRRVAQGDRHHRAGLAGAQFHARLPGQDTSDDSRRQRAATHFLSHHRFAAWHGRPWRDRTLICRTTR